MPRFILAEAKTHRRLSDHTAIEASDVGFNDDNNLSRNSASSRAIPTKRMLEMVMENPFIPIAWQKEHSGMQGTEYLTDPEDIAREVGYWLADRDYAVTSAKMRLERGVTKQIANRPLEAFMWHTVLVTATEYENFFALRCSQYVVNEDAKEIYYRSRKDLLKSIEIFPTIHNAVSNRTEVEWWKNGVGQAEIHMMATAEAMWDAMNESTPQQLKAGEWHIPFGNDMSNANMAYQAETKVKIATARCARISYKLPGEEDKPDNYENDIKLHDRLAASGHWSPFEHCAQAMSNTEFYSRIIGWSGNFRGFIQYRKMFNNENITK